MMTDEVLQWDLWGNKRVVFVFFFFFCFLFFLLGLDRPSLDQGSIEMPALISTSHFAISGRAPRQTYYIIEND